MVLILLLVFIFGCSWAVGWTHAHTHVHMHTYKQLKKFSVFSGFVVKCFLFFCFFVFLFLIPLPCMVCLVCILNGIFHFILACTILNSLNISCPKKKKKKNWHLFFYATTTSNFSTATHLAGVFNIYRIPRLTKVTHTISKRNLRKVCKFMRTHHI